MHVPQRKRRRKQAPRTPGSVTATRPDQVWALDYLFDATADGRPIKILNITDEYTREALTCTVGRRIDAEQTVTVLDLLVDRRGLPPGHIRCDNGPELVAETLNEWCRYAGTTLSYIEPGAPWQHPYVEYFNGHLRRELLELESFNSLYEAQVLIEDWRHRYNHYRPHQSLSYQTPAAFARQWHAPHQPARP